MRGRRRLPFGCVRVLLIRLVAADDASSDSADFAVPRQMARDAANDGAFDASLRLGGGARKGEAQNSGTDDERLSSKIKSLRDNRGGSNGFREKRHPRRPDQVINGPGPPAPMQTIAPECATISARKSLMDGAH